MTSPLAELAATVNDALGEIFFDAVLTREVVPSSPAYNPADPPAPELVNYPCKAIRDTYARSDRADPLILKGDAKILVLAGSLNTTPMENDNIEINGDGKKFSVVDFGTDPATACWVLQGRQ